MTHSIDHLNQIIDKAIENMPLDQKPQSLYSPIAYILSLGGKRIRPLLTLLSSNLFQDDIDSVLDSALAIEIFHNFTLLHDDLMDNSDKRRGKESVHKKWSPNTAILSGDAMLIEAYKYIAKTDKAFLPEVLDLFNTTSMEVCQGQQLDMDFESKKDVTVEEYIEMIRLKTGVLIGCALKMGAIQASASKEDAEKIYNFGINIGLAFQLQDDLLDVYGNSEKFGKPIGGDIINNKKTFLLIKAYELSNNQQKEELDKWINKDSFDPQEKIKAVSNIYNDLNLRNISDNLIKKYYLAALESLSSVQVQENRKQNIYKLSEQLLDREY